MTRRSFKNELGDLLEELQLLRSEALLKLKLENSRTESMMHFVPQEQPVMKVLFQEEELLYLEQAKV